MPDPSKRANVMSDYAAVVLGIGTYGFIAYLIFDHYQATGELTGWMLGALVLMLLLSLGTLFGFGRVEKAIELKDNL